MKLHIGGTERKDGWVNLNIEPGDYVDILGDCQDLSQFADDSIEMIYASHVIEHLSYAKELIPTLQEFRRVLQKPNGVLMISVPDMEVLCRMFLNSGLKDRFEVMRIIMGGQCYPHDFHKSALSYDILCEYLAHSGFSRIKRVDNFDLFNDYSKTIYLGEKISLNLEVYP